MKYSSFGYKALAVGTALSLALVGCGAINGGIIDVMESVDGEVIDYS